MERKLIALTSARLRELLLERSEYASRWQARVARQQAHAIHQSAVCHVIAEYLWDNGLHPEADLDLPRTLKDRVYRALSGRSLSRATLRWFIEAFEMNAEDSAELLRLSTPGRPADTVLGGIIREPGQLPPRHHATVSLRELHHIGPDGLPDSHRTVHTVRAVETMDRYSYVFDTDTASVHVVRGGRAGEPYAVDGGLFAVDIELEEPLLSGRTQTFEFVTRFWYRTPPPMEFRRAASRRLENVDLRVQFHHLRLPSQLWWSTWSSLDSEPATSEPVTLDAEKGVSRFLAALDPGIVGFRWTIPNTRSA